MSGLYAYCVLASGARPPVGLSGFGGAPVRAVDVAGLTVWLSDADRAPALDLDAVRLHHGVVSAGAAAAVVPFRFGAWAADTASLEERVRRSAAELEAALHRVEGRVELGVRITDPTGAPAADPGAAPATSGRAYLRALSSRQRARAERRRRQEQLAQAASRHLEAVPHDTRVAYLASPDLVSLAHLVPRGCEERYRRRMRSFADEVAPGLAVHVTGPWPPYSFVEA